MPVSEGLLRYHGPEVDADVWEPPLTDAELSPVGKALAELIPGAAGPIVDRDICLYTNTCASVFGAGSSKVTAPGACHRTRRSTTIRNVIPRASSR
jgi:hypothetical protein